MRFLAAISLCLGACGPTPSMHAVLEEGWRRHLALGKRDTQYKPPIILTERETADEHFISGIIETGRAKTAPAGIFSL